MSMYFCVSETTMIAEVAKLNFTTSDLSNIRKIRTDIRALFTCLTSFKTKTHVKRYSTRHVTLSHKQWFPQANFRFQEAHNQIFIGWNNPSLVESTLCFWRSKKAGRIEDCVLVPRFSCFMRVIVISHDRLCQCFRLIKEFLYLNISFMYGVTNLNKILCGNRAKTKI